MSTPPGPQTALIVRVPEAEAAVGALRTRFDPSAALGVPAHITVPHPFMAPDAIDAAVSARIGGIAAATRRFHYRLDTIARFPETLYLAPDPATPFIALTQALAAAFPDWPPYSGRHAGGFRISPSPRPTRHGSTRSSPSCTARSARNRSPRTAPRSC